ncbi:hypothetical protein SAMN05444580_111130 [Rhodococcus tukisamuensis]|uniref:Secreted protein n=2 Tax=Rhodococcus tukisamuensis TaxID=168276 RepID=A0A1G7AXH4_9NOCA|nr:hypothetical protein SAMN05444580_111130 [Rhodococcus tukisamuensis]
MNVVRRFGMCATVVVASGLSVVGVAAAAPVTVPFQVDPAPFGNPNGSFDVPPIRCAAVVGDRPGVVLITGGKPGRWGCPLSSQVHWLNLSTGATGSAQLSDGLHGFPAEATLNTGAGQVVVTVNPLGGGSVTPGFATFAVP